MLSLHHPKIPTAIDRPHRRYRYKSIRKYRLNQPKKSLKYVKKVCLYRQTFLIFKIHAILFKAILFKLIHPFLQLYAAKHPFLLSQAKPD